MSEGLRGLSDRLCPVEVHTRVGDPPRSSDTEIALPFREMNPWLARVLTIGHGLLTKMIACQKGLRDGVFQYPIL